jgi:hypothetical protein
MNRHPSACSVRRSSRLSTPSATTSISQRLAEAEHRLDGQLIVVGQREAGNETAVDLDAVHAQPAQRRQRQIANPEMIYRDTDPGVRQARELSCHAGKRPSHRLSF